MMGRMVAVLSDRALRMRGLITEPLSEIHSPASLGVQAWTLCWRSSHAQTKLTLAKLLHIKVKTLPHAGLSCCLWTSILFLIFILVASAIWVG